MTLQLILIFGSPLILFYRWCKNHQGGLLTYSRSNSIFLSNTRTQWGAGICSRKNIELGGKWQVPAQLLPDHVMMDKLFTISEPAPSTRIWRDILWMLKDNACKGTIRTVVHCMNINAFSFSLIQSIISILFLF